MLRIFYLLFACTLLPLQLYAAQTRILDIELSYSPPTDTSTTHVGYRVYQNNTLICEKFEPDATILSCEFITEDGEFDYTLAAIFDDGSESSASQPFSFFIGDSSPPLPNPDDGSHIITYSWNDSGLDSTVAGYRMYMNDTVLCETTSTTASSLSCAADLVNMSMTFSIASFDSAGNESAKSNFLLLDPSDFPDIFPTDPPVADLVAVASASPPTGTAPLSVTFDGTASTGDIAGYSWDFGDGSTANGATVNHSYTVPGLYSATLIVTDTGGQTSNINIDINVNEGSTTTSPPTASISSSVAAGNAPLEVVFDGSGSTNGDAPITSYQWNLGDGSTATGISVTHMYSVAGTYNVELVVTDEAGLQDTTSTPVIVNEAQQENQIPTAAISSSGPTQGDSPLTVVLNGSQSTDPDGSIVSYDWDFGDGSTASGMSVQHTYTNATEYQAQYTVTLRVKDNSGAYSQYAATQITVSGSSPQTSFGYEIGELNIDENWVTVEFANTFTSPVIIVSPPSSNDSDPAVVRIRNLTATGFEIRLQEWDYLDGVHDLEQINYLVLEEGLSSLTDGTKIEAGFFNGSTEKGTISFQHDFIFSPIVLTTVVSENETNAVTGRISEISAQQFSYVLQEEEAADQAHQNENVAYIAWQPGNGSDGELSYEASVLIDSINHNWGSISYQATMASNPYFFAGMQSTNADNTASLRMQNAAVTGIELRVEEEQSKDRETKHRAESIGYLALVPSSTADTTSDTDSTPQVVNITWEYTGDEQAISGFRVYLNNDLLCETADPSARELSCETQLQTQANSFTVRAIDATGTESDLSNAIEYNP